MCTQIPELTTISPQRKSQSGADRADLVTYLRTEWSNYAGTVSKGDVSRLRDTFAKASR